MVFDRCNLARRCGGGAGFVGFKTWQQESVDRLVDDWGDALSDGLSGGAWRNAWGLSVAEYCGDFGVLGVVADFVLFVGRAGISDFFTRGFHSSGGGDFPRICFVAG